MTSMAGRAGGSSGAGSRSGRDAEGLESAADEASVELAQFADVQRVRLLAATARVACERGGAKVTVAEVIETAGVSRRTFYELFASVEACMLATLDDAVERVAERALPAWRADGAWQERMRAALVEILAFCEESPLAARILFVESQAAGPALVARRNEIQARLMAAVEEGRKAKRETAGPGPLTAEGIVGGAISLVSARLTGAGAFDAKGPDLLGLANALMSMIVLPYLGAAAARKEEQRPAPKRALAAGAREEGGVSMRDLGVRLTYRRLRVLLAVAEHPCGSNRLIGKLAGIDDQGQISKLLGRLEQIGIVENTRAPADRGAPNAWVLTDKGKRIFESVRLRAGGEGAAAG